MSQTVIGPATRISGALGGKDDLVVEGAVDGPIHGEASVIIKPGARVGGEVRGHDVTIAGELEHPVFATGVVRLLATAKLTGDIEAPRISIDEGAVFEGQVRMRRPQPLAAQAPQPVASIKPQPIAQPTTNTPIVQTHNKPELIVQTHNKPELVAQPIKAAQPPAPANTNTPRAIPELAAPGRKRLIRKTP